VTINLLDISDITGYQKWRDQKVRAYENKAHLVVVDIQGDKLTKSELLDLKSACDRFNYTIYRLQDPELGTKNFVHEAGLQLGLKRLDGNLCSDEDNITSIQVMESGRHSVYIPYTDKKLTWHTDGYYNEDANTIRSMILHCVRPAETGGENLMLDHEMAYIQLRDENPLYIEAFTQANVLTIPPNIENGKEIRGAKSGPVFSIDSLTDSLHMRFSARTRNIQWKEDSLTQEAVECMRGLLNENNPHVITYRMNAGEGIIANNVLHNRTAFTDGEETRLLYRARYYDRVEKTDRRQS